LAYVPAGAAELSAIPARASSSGNGVLATNEDIANLARHDLSGDAGSAPHNPRSSFWPPPAGGAPNVVGLTVSGSEPQGVKELDDNFIAMHLALAQQLVYGRGEHKVTGIVLQLRRSEIWRQRVRA